eukprot:697908-Lingulodinium_polyedra.AAC.1
MHSALSAGSRVAPPCGALPCPWLLSSSLSACVASQPSYPRPSQPSMPQGYQPSSTQNGGHCRPCTIRPCSVCVRCPLSHRYHLTPTP